MAIPRPLTPWASPVIYPNTIKKGLQWRENMDLVLCVNSDDITTGNRPH